MYEIRAALLSQAALGDRILDDLVALFEAQAQDCTVGVADGPIVGYVEADMLADVTKTVLRHLPKVKVQIATEANEELAFA